MLQEIKKEYLLHWIFLAEKKGVNKSSLISFWISDEYERVKNSEKKEEKK